MKKILVPVVLIVIAAGVGVARYWNGRGHDGELGVSGTVEATEVDIAPKITGRIEAVLVDEGDRVEKGRLLVRLDDRELAAQSAVAEAGVTAARARLKNLEAGSRGEEIRKARAILEQTEAALEKNRSDWKRADRLHADGMISDQEWERLKQDLEVGEARRREAREQLNLLMAGARREEIEEARAELGRAAASLEFARAQLENMRLVSPLSGTVLLRNREPGEMAGPDAPILTLGDLDHLWVTVYVRETELGRVEPGQPAEVSVDTFPGKVYAGRVSYVSDEAEFTPKTVQTAEERVKLVFKVKVSVDNVNGELKPGMPADVRLVAEKNP